MDVRNWPLNKIMQLPDCCFGRRWPVTVAIGEVSLGTYYDISEMGLPEVCVVWAWYYMTNSAGVINTIFSLALADTLPTTDAEFDAGEVLFPGMGLRNGLRREFSLSARCGNLVLSTKEVLQSGGRRLVGRFEVLADTTLPTVVGVVISSTPKEVPDWLVSH